MDKRKSQRKRFITKTSSICNFQEKLVPEEIFDNLNVLVHWRHGCWIIMDPEKRVLDSLTLEGQKVKRIWVWEEERRI